MLSKPKLIKKGSVEEVQIKGRNKSRNTAQHERVTLTVRTIQSTKNWLASHRQQQHNARQTFAALFMTQDTQSNAI